MRSVQLLLTTMLSDTPLCASDRLRASGWRGPVIAMLKKALPRRALRRLVGVEPPYGPPFLRVLAAVAGREWFSWIPTMGLPPVLALPGTITFRPDKTATMAAMQAHLERPRLEQSVFDSILPFGSSSQEIAGTYTYACKDIKHADFYYIFRYQAFWMPPSSMTLLQSICSLCVKMLLMHCYASIFMLLSQSNCREAFAAELDRRRDRLRRWWKPRPPVRLIPIESGDLCAFCHEELLPPDEQPEEAAADAEAPRSRWWLFGSAASATPADAARQSVLHCRWGCGKAVHKSCATGWGRNACVYCSAPMS